MTHGAETTPDTAPPGSRVRLVVRRRRTRRQIDVLDRLVALMLAEGFSAFTLDDLAARLRCSKTTLYQLAASKQQLVVEVVKHFFRTATEHVESRVAQRANPADQVVAYLDAAAEQLRPASREFLADVADFPPAQEVYEHNTRRAADRVRELIAQGVDSGAFRDVHAAFAAEVVAATMTQIQRGQINERTGLSDSAAYAELASLVVHAVSNHES